MIAIAALVLRRVPHQPFAELSCSVLCHLFSKRIAFSNKRANRACESPT